MTQYNISRRSMLKSAGSIVAFGAIGSVPASAQKSSQVRLIEAGVTYNVPERDDYKAYHHDSTPQYVVDPDEDTLTILPEMTESLQQKLGRGSTVAAGKNVSKGPGTVVPAQDTTQIPVRTGSKLQPSSTIQTDSSVTLPEVALDSSESRPQMSINGQQVQAEGLTQVSLSPQTVELKTRTVLDERVDNDQIPPEQRALKTVEGSVTVDVVPEVAVRDYGTLDIAELR